MRYYTNRNKTMSLADNRNNRTRQRVYRSQTMPGGVFAEHRSPNLAPFKAASLFRLERVAPEGRFQRYAPAFLPTFCCSLCSVWSNGGHHDQCFLAESVTLRYGSEYPRISTQIGLSVVGTGQRNTASKHSLKYYFCSAHGGSRLPSLSAFRLWITLVCFDPTGEKDSPGRHRKRCLIECSNFILSPFSLFCQYKNSCL